MHFADPLWSKIKGYAGWHIHPTARRMKPYCHKRTVLFVLEPTCFGLSTRRAHEFRVFWCNARQYAPRNGCIWGVVPVIPLWAYGPYAYSGHSGDWNIEEANLRWNYDIGHAESDFDENDPGDDSECCYSALCLRCNQGTVDEPQFF